MSGDSELRWSMARTMIRMAGGHVEEGVRSLYATEGRGGHRYLIWGMGQPLLFVPFTALGLALERLGFPGDVSDNAAQFLACLLLFPAVGAGCVALLHRLCLQLGAEERGAKFAAILFGAASMHFHYSSQPQEQTQVSFLLLLALVTATHKPVPGLRRSVLSCAALGSALLFRPAALPVALSLYLGLAARGIRNAPGHRSGVWLQWFYAGCMGTGPFVLALLGWNYFRFRDVLETGHRLAAPAMFGGLPLLNPDIGAALAGVLFSPGKSLFVFNPVLLLFPFAWRHFFRREACLGLAVLGAAAGNLLLNSSYVTWAGDYAWGPRYQTDLLPLLFFPLAFAPVFQDSPVRKYVLYVLAGTSFCIQLLSVVYNFHLEFVQNPNIHLVPDHHVWQAEHSQIVRRARNVWQHIRNERDFSSVPVETELPQLLKTNRSQEQVKQAWILNAYPFRAKAVPGTQALFYPLLGLWGLNLLLLVWSGKRVLSM